MRTCKYFINALLSQVHCAAISGNVDIMKWLVEEQHCMLYDAAAVIKKGTDANADTTRVSSNTLPLLNGAGHSVLAVTARRGDAPMMRYLTQNRHCSVTDIADVTLLHRALHVALEVTMFELLNKNFKCFVLLSVSLIIPTYNVFFFLIPSNIALGTGSIAYLSKSENLWPTVSLVKWFICTVCVLIR